uniref:Saccharopine dehydrogenase NADP binding domain-containing protein n=2 Tax=Aegilops tauschii subsp. strangulata TaxID=200361 RepID=A0A453PTS3_AEGTS
IEWVINVQSAFPFLCLPQSAELPLRLTGNLNCHEPVGADDTTTLDKIIDSLTSIANAHRGDPNAAEISLKIGRVSECGIDDSMDKVGPKVLILGAGRVCRPAAEFLTSYQNIDQVHVVVASLYQKDAEETVDGIKNATAAQLDVSDTESLSNLVSQVDVVVSLLPASFHAAIARVCIELKKHLVTASYVDDSMSKLEQAAQGAGVTILCEMGLDPGIDHMLSMKMIDEAHALNGKIKAFTSFCGGLPSPAAANNPLAYKFRLESSRCHPSWKKSCCLQISWRDNRCGW